MRMTNVGRQSKTAVINGYFSWLCDLIEVNQPEKSYWLLANALHNREFFWSVPNDDNRAFEGKNLRECFCEENHIDDIFYYFDGGCTMLELIIALAYRCDNIMVDQSCGMDMKDWFWKMMENIGLDRFNDDDYYHCGGQIILDEILNKIINRTYHRSGRGGLFPLKSPKKDQRKVELWYQMSAYLVENYYTEDAVV
jgi:hypothetical protein